eukprot:Gregarina_sp_Poly_1__2971@NODE_1832_length_3252_cov_230_314600_g1190_i0_p5_GENE_NODE_1832_length_3252_cov_230_314600_g1190_i0NODE_1832_length_3252_cov_230_314600_g1190_i0_p5_ORF_typecomplete_len129_score17_50Ribosomal_L38e/PF01781_18/6_9e10Lipoprotein_9/PF03180_14/0_027Lipoprotein_9/PF03180_14/4_4e03DUF956/PF06115_11/0_032DUF3038/PF11237_8/0_065_NODE_1832_length_3252_cov_230_314600_g1190_i09081294
MLLASQCSVVQKLDTALKRIRRSQTQNQPKSVMPKECKDMKEFIELLVTHRQAQGKPDAKKVVKILEKRQANKVITKFKVKTTKGGLYTLIVADREKAVRLEKALPSHVVKEHVGRLRTTKASKAKKN